MLRTWHDVAHIHGIHFLRYPRRTSGGQCVGYSCHFVFEGSLTEVDKEFLIPGSRGPGISAFSRKIILNKR